MWRCGGELSLSLGSSELELLAGDAVYITRSIIQTIILQPKSSKVIKY
jgi:hypothetical protein